MGSNMKFLVVLSAIAVAVANGAPQLPYAYGGYGLGLGAVHAIPTVAKQTLTYKTAAFEAVDAGVYGAGVYGGLAGYPYGLHGLPVVAAAAAEEPAVAEE